MRNVKLIAVLIVVLIVVVIAGSFLYTVSETQQVVITQFGKHKRVVQEAGLHFKIPILEQVNYYEKRILEWDGNPKEIPTLNKDVTRRRLYIEALGKVLPNLEKKYIIDDNVKGLLPLMNVGEK